MKGRPRLPEMERRGKNQAQAESIQKACVTCEGNANILRSLQPCSLKDNRCVLQRVLEQTNTSQHKKNRK